MFTLFLSLLVAVPVEGKSVVEIRRAESKPAEGLVEAVDPGAKDKVYLHAKVELTDKDIASARLYKPKLGDGVGIAVEFTKEGAAKMGKLTREHLNKRLAILVEGKVIAAPTIRAVITDKSNIEGKFSREQAEVFVKAVNRKATDP